MSSKEISPLKLFPRIPSNTTYYGTVEDSLRKSYSLPNGSIWALESEMRGCITKNMTFAWITDDKKK